MAFEKSGVNILVYGFSLLNALGKAAQSLDA
jgi:hypothetical protein